MVFDFDDVNFGKEIELKDPTVLEVIDIEKYNKNLAKSNYRLDIMNP